MLPNGNIYSVRYEQHVGQEYGRVDRRKRILRCVKSFIVNKKIEAMPDETLERFEVHVSKSASHYASEYVAVQK